jgi:hypothetical protein
MSERLNNWTSRQKLSAAHLNEAWNLLRKLAGVVGYDLNSVEKPKHEDPIPRVRLGKIVAAGPSSPPEADWADERYWVIDSGITAGDTQNSLVVPVDLVPIPAVSDSDSVLPVIHTVTNVPEILAHTHGLAVGTAVLYFELIDFADPTPNTRRVMAVGGLDDLGELDGQVHQMTSQLESGWADLRLVNRS